jgi:hypothetical protein
VKPRLSEGHHAEKGGVYGCVKCGAYQRLATGAGLACRCCRTPLPLVFVRDFADGEDINGRSIVDRSLE